MSTINDVTQGKRNRSGTGGEGGTDRIEARERVGPGLRLRVRALAAWLRRIPFRLPLVALGSWLGASWRRASDSSPYSDRPPSLRDVVEYTRAGGWIPGDHPWWVELPGYVYGVLVAIPGAVVGNAWLWVQARPGRVLIAALVYVLLRWAGVDLLAWVPVRLDWVGVT